MPYMLDEKTFNISTQGDRAFGSSVWLDSTFLGSWSGTSATSSNNSTYLLPILKQGGSHIITVLVDNNGLELNPFIGQDSMKSPRGILNFAIDGNHTAVNISWKLTGNLGGEDYTDLVRGPLNEGGLYVERQGWHQPSPPSSNWSTLTGLPLSIDAPGVGFFTVSFDLDIPKG